MKSVHRALQLRHHKHTGKLLPHKHTSYGVLFLLMLVPIAMMALVGHLVSASDLAVSAKVPAPMPNGAPVITQPADGSIISSDTVVVSGTCPVIKPAIIIVIYVQEAISGSTPCSVDGKFAVRIPLSLGMQKIVAQVVTITDDIGKSSKEVTVLRAAPATQPRSDARIRPDDTLQALSLLVGIVTNDRFVPIGADGKAQWHGSFVGGERPYRVIVDWGDGTKSSYDISDQNEQTLSHRYGAVGNYDITITVTDANGMSASIHSAAMSVLMSQTAAIDDHFGPVPPPFVLIQKYLWQIYILSLSGLIFLWYLEHGRHLYWPTLPFGHRYRHTHRHRRS